MGTLSASRFFAYDLIALHGTFAKANDRAKTPPGDVGVCGEPSVDGGRPAGEDERLNSVTNELDTTAPAPWVARGVA
jgi:hypothetical protein